MSYTAADGRSAEPGSTGTEFAYFDGDDIGAPLELALLEDDPGKATRYSNLVSTAMNQLAAELSSHNGVRVLFSGGDDMFASWPNGAVDPGEMTKLQVRFSAVCGRTISVGVGATPSEALGNLRRAKLRGKARTVTASEAREC